MECGLDGWSRDEGGGVALWSAIAVVGGLLLLYSCADYILRGMTGLADGSFPACRIYS